MNDVISLKLEQTDLNCNILHRRVIVISRDKAHKEYHNISKLSDR